MSEPLILRDYQAAGNDAVRDKIREGHKRIIICGPTGSGKTEQGIAILQNAAAKSSRTAFVCDRIALINQTSKRLDDHGIEHGIIQSGHWRWRPYERIQVCSAQTLARRGISEDMKLIVCDECFIAGTMIETAKGPKKIESVRSGDIVYNALGCGPVLATSARPLGKRHIVRVRFSDGTEISCTSDHRVFTTNAWVQAGKLAGESVIGIEDMPSLWQGVSSGGAENNKGVDRVRERKDLARKIELLKSLLSEHSKPNVQRGNEKKGSKNSANNRASPKDSGGQRQRADKITADDVADTWERMAGRICGEDRAKGEGRISSRIQNRYRKSSAKGGNRAGRQQPQVIEKTSGGRKEKRIFGAARVVGVQVEESTSDQVVYNLHVGGHPSYFANGKLVHNCHTLYATTTKFILAHPDVVTIGLTATPFNKSLGSIYTAVVNVTTTNKLLAAGHLAPLKIFVCRAIDTKGLKLKFDGEWNEEEVSKRSLAIVGDVVSEWTKKTNEIFGGPVKTIVFSDSVASGAELVKQFNAHGHNFIQLSYLDGNDTMTQEILEEYRKPDTNITGLISVEKLAKGFDVPDIQCVVLMKPYRKSLSGVIQQIGRGMRSAPGKEFCLVNDHSGNIDRFASDIAEFFENGVSKLDDSKLDDKVRTEPEEAEREARNCQSCGYTPIMRAMIECPHCHAEIKRRVALHVPGEMHELTLGPNGKKLEPWLQDREAVAGQIWCLAMRRKKGDKEAAIRFAKAQYRNLFGTWSPRRIDSYTPQEPHPLLVQRIRANLIRWRYSKHNPANAK